MLFIYCLLALLITVSGFILHFLLQVYRSLDSKARSQDDLNHQLSKQLYQSVESLKKDLFELEKNTKLSLDHSLNNAEQRSTQMIIDQQQRNHQMISEVSGKLQHLHQWQKDIFDLNSRISKLGKILDNTNLKGKFGEIQLEILLKNILPHSWIKEQHSLPNGSRVDFMIQTNKHTLSLCIDSKFPVQSYRLLVDHPENKQYLKDFMQVIKKNIQDISQKYILPKVTLDFALLFVPSESLFSQILYFEDLMTFAQTHKVLLCSPQTLHWQLLLLKKMVLEFGIDELTQSKAHLVQEFSKEHEKVLEKVQLIEKKTLLIQRDLSHVTSTIQKQMKFIEGLLSLDDSNDHAEDNQNSEKLVQQSEKINEPSETIDRS